MQLKRFMMFSSIVLVLLSAAGTPAEEAKEASEPEFIIVKYGSVHVSSPEAEGRVYIDGVYKGNTDRVIEAIIADEHLVSCQADGKSVSGTFRVKKGETLRLQALFGQGKLVREPAKQTEAEKREPEPARRQAPKKAAVRDVETKSDPVEERRKAHLNVMKINYEIGDSHKLKIRQESNSKVISKYSSWKNSEGAYYRTKQGLLLCDRGPCEMTWSAKFLYTDNTGGTDALLLKWKETVFNGITPAGTSRQDLECCLNGECWKMKEPGPEGKPREFEVGRYRVFWSNGSVLVRRSDIMKEILDAGRSLNDY